MDPKQGRIYGKGTPFKRAPQRFGEEISPNSPPLDPPLWLFTVVSSRAFQIRF